MKVFKSLFKRFNSIFYIWSINQGYTPMISNFLLLFFLSFGLGGFLPGLNRSRELCLGVRLLGGYALLTCLLYVGIVMLDLGVTVSLYTLIATGLIGGIVLVRRATHQFSLYEHLFHPSFVLPVLIIAFLNALSWH
jgi:hypothetical protein